MKQYWEIQGPSKAPQAPCIAFEKLDGSNMRFEWSRKRGWYKFGTRHCMIDATDKMFGSAIPLFLKEYGEGLERIFRDNKEYRNNEGVIVFCEWFGPNSLAGWHDPVDAGAMELVLFDVNINKKGFVLPREFIRNFESVRTAPVLYEGNFSKEFVRDVYDGKYGEKYEGVVAKGVIHGMKNDQHGLWYAKAKTGWWLRRLKEWAEKTPEKFGKQLADNLKEQEIAVS